LIPSCLSMRVVLFVLLWGVVACTPEKPPVPVGFVSQRVDFLPDRWSSALVGQVRLYVPERYDTLLQWVDQSDAGGTVKYRFTRARGCLIKESGFIHVTFCDDSLDRLTLETDRVYGLTARDTALFGFEAQQAQDRQTGPGDFAWRAKEWQLIHQRPFAVQAFWGTRLLGVYHTKEAYAKRLRPYEQLIARTLLRQGGASYQLTFRFECKQGDCQGFAQRANTVLNSIEIDTLASIGSAPPKQ
jgi:hypothetical protein